MSVLRAKMNEYLPSDLVQKIWDMTFGPNEVDKTRGCYEDGYYFPSPVDIYVTRLLLSQGMKLPAIVVDSILDHAEYWVRSTNEVKFHGSFLRIPGRGPRQNTFLLRSLPIGLTKANDQDASTLNQPLEPSDLAKKAPAKELKHELDPSYFRKQAGHPTPRLVHPVRKVVFKIRSHDQGWADNPGSSDPNFFAGSFTWFEAGLERFDATQQCEPLCRPDGRDQRPGSEAPPLPCCALRPIQPLLEKVSEDDEKPVSGPKDFIVPPFRYDHPLLPSPQYLIQKNRRAYSKFMTHQVTWSYLDDIQPGTVEAEQLEKKGRGTESRTGDFVKELKMGDVVTLWAKARFSGWSNTIQFAKMEVYWAL